jgi:hypothetical protein
MSPVEDVSIQEQAHVNIERGVVSTESVQVRVLAATGLFKNGMLIHQGAEVSMHPETAKNFARIGEVEIINRPPEETNA